MSTRTLMLTPWMTPHGVIPWQRAVVLFFLGKVEVLEEYEEDIVAPSVTLRTPAVVRLTKGRAVPRHKVHFSRVNVFTRDGFRCQYCGTKKEMKALNYDHVLPRVRGGKTSWENIVTSCYACNARKGGRTPSEAGMKLLRKPTRPTWLPLTPIVRSGADVPASWRFYVGDPGRADEANVA